MCIPLERMHATALIGELISLTRATATSEPEEAGQANTELNGCKKELLRRIKEYESKIKDLENQLEKLEKRAKKAMEIQTRLETYWIE